MSKATFMSAMDIKSEASNGKYLRLPVYMGKSKVQTFTYLNEIVWKRTQGWKDKLLSRVGKAVLIKATAQAIPTYAMSCFDLTNAVFVWLWLMVGADLLRENNTADWPVAGGWCWFSMRGQHCWLVGWQVKRTQRKTLCDDIGAMICRYWWSGGEQNTLGFLGFSL